MTTQDPDSCTIDGRKWVIEDWNGPRDCVPTNEQLGVRTISPSTANWSGRIDHFLVHRRQLYLFKTEVTLAPENKGVLPFGSRREVVLRYDQVEAHDRRGMHMAERKRRYEYLVFDDLLIPFSGRLRLSFPFFDYWEVPWPIDEKDDQTTEEINLEFINGLLI